MKGQSFYHAHFDGSIGEYGPIFFKNLILTILTLGIYSAWAATENRKYFLSHLEIASRRYFYHGTGLELLIGRLKAMGILLIVALSYVLLFIAFPKLLDDSYFIAGLSLFVFLFTLLPVAIVWMLKYRLSRTSWNNIHMNFSGDWREFLPIYVNGVLLTLLTLGFYVPFFTVRVYKYLIGKSRVGNKRYRFDGDGKELFPLFLRGLVLTLLTLGIYYFWFLADYYSYLINHTTIDGCRYHFRSTGLAFLTLIVPNVLILLLTFGLGTPIVFVQSMKFFAKHLYLDANFDPQSMKQGHVDTVHTTGDGLLSMLEANL